MRTYFPKAGDLTPRWVLLDADGQRLGRMATQIATILRGKHRPTFTPNADTGDFVVVVNAGRIALTGRKIDNKTYFRHSTHPGGSTILPMRHVMEQRPEWVLRRAVWGMLPHGPLGRKLIRKLKIYSGPAHPHRAQNPQTSDVAAPPASAASAR
ncbi:MAG: 50S ribosomal protein L13 [Calditrichaeota bacterium]|nr:50S ribosomal protein L13 [Calditrichota bacterium]